MARNRAPEHPRSCRRACLGQKKTPEPIPMSKRPVVGQAGSILSNMEICTNYQFLLLPWFFASRCLGVFHIPRHPSSATTSCADLGHPSHAQLLRWGGRGHEGSGSDFFVCQHHDTIEGNTSRCNATIYLGAVHGAQTGK